MIGSWSDCVKKEVPWNPSVTISHNQIIISGARKNRRTSTARAPLSNMHNCSSLNGPTLALTIDFCHFLTLLIHCKIGKSHLQIGSMMVASWRICFSHRSLNFHCLSCISLCSLVLYFIAKDRLIYNILASWVNNPYQKIALIRSFFLFI